MSQRHPTAAFITSVVTTNLLALRPTMRATTRERHTATWEPAAGRHTSASTKPTLNPDGRCRRHDAAGSLDDVSEANGTVHLLPYDRAGTRDVIAHHRDPETNDLIGYSGDDPGDPMTVPAGSIAAFSGIVFHRTGPNTSNHPRRVYIARYTAEPLLSEDRSRRRHLAEPLLLAGQQPPDQDPQNR